MVLRQKTSRRRVLAGAAGLTTTPLWRGQDARANMARQEAPPQRGGEVTILMTNDFVSMDPIHASGPTARACYDWLLAWRPDQRGFFDVRPMLATEWETTDEALIFTIREGVKFHDGSDLNAEAVAWNLNRMVQNPESFAKNYLPAIDEETPAQALGPTTVRVNLTRPSASILSSLSDAREQAGIVSMQSR